MEAMEGTIILASITTLFLMLLLGISLHLWLCKHKLHQHHHINSLEKALPIHAPHVQQLIQELSSIANIVEPDVFVYRAALPNAFVAAMPLQANLYIADELFEKANEARDPLHTLAYILAHEIAHLKQKHAFKHAFYTYLTFVQVCGLTTWAKRKLCVIEEEADIEAENIVRQFYSQG